MPVKKNKVIYDLEDFPIKKDEGGLYAILPYEKLDKHKKALFKVGLANSFEHRFETYHTYYPLGFYMKSLLASPKKGMEEFKVKSDLPKTKENRELLNKQMKMKYYKNIENYIFKNLKDHGAKQLTTTTRIKNYNENLGQGDTEWFYTNEKTIDNAFDNAFKIYGGRLKNDHLNNINKNAENNKKNSTYSAEIHYKIYS